MMMPITSASGPQQPTSDLDRAARTRPPGTEEPSINQTKKGPGELAVGNGFFGVGRRRCRPGACSLALSEGAPLFPGALGSSYVLFAGPKSKFPRLGYASIMIPRQLPLQSKSIQSDIGNLKPAEPAFLSVESYSHFHFISYF